MAKKQCRASVAGRSAARKPVRARWTVKRRALFLAVLTDSANVRQSAAAAGMSLTAAYDLKARDPAFARAWREALETGYSEVELALLRQSLHGSERTETVEEGEEKTLKYVKTVRSFNSTVAVRLLMAHREEVLAFRRERDGETAPAQGATAQLENYLAEIRARLAEAESAGTDTDGTPGEADAADEVDREGHADGSACVVESAMMAGGQPASAASATPPGRARTASL